MSDQSDILNPSDSARRYMNTRETAAYIGMSTQWLEIGRHKGYGPPFIKLSQGKSAAVRYDSLEVDAYMAKNKRVHT